MYTWYGSKSGPPAITRLNAQMYMPAHHRFIDSFIECVDNCASRYAIFNLLEVSHALGGSLFMKAKFQSLRGSSCYRGSWSLTSESTISDPSSGLLLDAAEALLAANFASGRTLSEGLWATGAAAEPPEAGPSATAGSLLQVLSSLDCCSSSLGLFRLALELLCSGSTG
jgi:hypothetical protein